VLKWIFCELREPQIDRGIVLRADKPSTKTLTALKRPSTEGEWISAAAAGLRADDGRSGFVPVVRPACLGLAGLGRRRRGLGRQRPRRPRSGRRRHAIGRVPQGGDG